MSSSWEYPGNQGIGCNAISPNDTTNFLSFLQELRQDPVGKKLFLTAATPIAPWKGADGQSLSDVSDFANVLDYIAIMNYDINGGMSQLWKFSFPRDQSANAVHHP